MSWSHRSSRSLKVNLILTQMLMLRVKWSWMIRLSDLDTNLADQFSDELDQELDSDADQDSDADVDDSLDESTASHGFMELSHGSANPFSGAISKMKNAVKNVVAAVERVLNPFAVKLPPESPAVVLTPAEHQAKWAAFKAANPNKKYKTPADEQKAFNAFQANRAQILDQNNDVATRLNPKPFSSKGPFADLPKDQFKATLKIRAPGAGGAVGASGTSASASGTSASASGTSASASGTSASASGTSASKSGKIGGASGTSASNSGGNSQASGTSASSSGTSASNEQVVAPTDAELAAAAKFDPYPGPNFNNVADDTLEKRLCRVISNVWFAMYAATATDRFLEFGVGKILGKATGGGFDRFQQNPMLLCNDAGWDAFWDKIHPKQVLIRNAFKELLSHPAGTPFMNPVVATSDQALDQAQCGSCYAQAAVGSLEAALKKAGRLGGGEQLSVQQVIDCVHTKDSNGCGGGTPMDALAYFQTTAPSLAIDYPYTGVKGTCNIKKADPKHRSSGWEFVKPPAGGLNLNWLHPFKPCTSGPCIDQYKYEMDIMFGVKSAGPYIIYVDADQWQHYGGGIYPPAHCSSRNEAGNHVVQLLGYGQQDGTPYWIIKNSWGESWGENGYIKLPMGVNACGMANFVIKANA